MRAVRVRNFSRRLFIMRAIVGDGPFVSVNCGAIPGELIQSELFGYAEGAFTGAKRGGRPGKLELADGGSIFLDEIGDMPLEMQVNLLRVLEEKAIVRVGDNKVTPVDVRVIAATNRSLYDEVSRGRFPRRPVLPIECHSHNHSAPQGPQGRHQFAYGLLH